MNRLPFLFLAALSLGTGVPVFAQQPNQAPPAAPAPPANFGNIPVPPPKVKPKPANKNVPMRMVIDAKSMDFNRETNVAIFRGKVTLRSQDMDIDCEELEVHFKKGALEGESAEKKPAEKKPPTPAPEFDPNKPNKLEDGAKPADGSEPNPNQPTQKIEIAYARGKGSIVTIVKRAADKGPTICKSGDAIFEEKTGKLTLKIFPEVSTPTQRLSANERDTNIFVDNQGRVSADGSIRTSLLEDQKKTAPKPAPTATGTPSSPPAPALTPKPSTTPTPPKPNVVPNSP